MYVMCLHWFCYKQADDANPAKEINKWSCRMKAAKSEANEKIQMETGMLHRGLSPSKKMQ